MSGHALSVVEFDRVLDWIAGRASSDPGKAAVRALRPSADPVWIRAELERVDAVRALLQQALPWGPPALPDVDAALLRLPVEGGALSASELHALAGLMTAAVRVSETIDRHGEGLDALDPIRERLFSDARLTTRLERSVDGTGAVLDSASSELAALRRRLRKARQTLVRRLEAFTADLPERVRVPDASVSLRDGRYVVPIRREGKSEVGGIVHDESATGATLFVEPPVALGLMNELRSTEAEEAREIHRILLELTAVCRPHAATLEGSRQALVAFDSLYARARAAGEFDASTPTLSEGPEAPLRIVRGRHPLLVARGEDTVVPFDLTLEPDERVLVVSGPNTGGKSVLLKSVGLISSLTQAGILPPVGPGTVLPVFHAFFADIGDEQSVARDLSTFSAHLLNLNRILEGADDASLVLIDEMGTGTDPAEGAALARAILERLVWVGARGIATSHLGALKRLDAPSSGIVNASLQFDADRMEPTYHFVKGRPGRSFGLAIARRSGLSEDVLEAAEGFIDSGDASIEDLLERLEKQDREAEGLVASLAEERDRASRLRVELEEREAELRAFEKGAERKARDEARQLLMEARSEVEQAIETVKQAQDEKALASAGKAARRAVEEAAEKQRTLRPRRDRRASSDRVAVVGDRVRMAGSGTEGTVVEIRDTKALVEASGLRLRVAVHELEVLKGTKPKRKAAVHSTGWAPDEDSGLSEVDLRGLRVDEVEFQLGSALDRAVVTEVPELRIIHGMGTGAVRARVTELLRRDGRVSDFRLGERGEGGAGVTVARFR